MRRHAARRVTGGESGLEHAAQQDAGRSL